MMTDVCNRSEIELGSSHPSPSIGLETVTMTDQLPHSSSNLPRTPRDIRNAYPPVSLPDKRSRSDPNSSTNSPSRLYAPSPTVPSTSGSSSAASSPTTHHPPSRAPFHASPRIGGTPRSISGGPGSPSSPARGTVGDGATWDRTGVERQCGGDLNRMVDMLLAERNTLVSSRMQSTSPERFGLTSDYMKSLFTGSAERSAVEAHGETACASIRTEQRRRAASRRTRSSYIPTVSTRTSCCFRTSGLQFYSGNIVQTVESW
jgi:hypothetical protein